ncbi:peptidoglycan-binding protein [Streptomyces sp. NBC_01218]|uniref:peptidoglycan-binding domain-containing protein n=1 Tax=unclassified Streptomyces TaxID=2593676 RepID=UPI0023BA1B17|nr:MULTISPECIES: peptidoglycan-binding domain-containing protein [unclassified Streptomyces]WEH41644.1 peptidoglycan-binding domain-containing protein [Streptomyces sp. AM 2-1-1]WSQ53271.1 peptidoglycan-binding protein [Streptomyces sp. NBC_01218]
MTVSRTASSSVPSALKRRVVALAGAAALTLGAFAVAPGAAAAPDAAAPSVAAVPGGCAYTSSSNRPVLRSGSSGAAVKQAQCLSNVWGGVPKLAVDGKFGTKTQTKIKWIQGCHGLVRDGVVGTLTWQALYHPVPDCYDPYPS